MIRTPAQHQTDPAKAPGVVREPVTAVPPLPVPSVNELNFLPQEFLVLDEEEALALADYPYKKL